MKHVVSAIGLLLIGALLIYATAVRAAMFGDTAVRLLGVPHCAINTLPTAVGGPIAENLTGSQQTPWGFATDPWYPWPQFRGVTPYNALFGGPNAPAIAYYVAAAPETSFRLIFGTPFEPEYVDGFYRGEHVFRFSSEELNRRFHNSLTGPKASLNLEVIPPGPVDEIDLIARAESLEHAFNWGSAREKCD